MEGGQEEEYEKEVDIKRIEKMSNGRWAGRGI